MQLFPGTGSCAGSAPVRWSQSNASIVITFRSKISFRPDEKKPAMYEFPWVLLRSRKLSSRTLSTSTTVFSPAPDESEGTPFSGVRGV